MFMFSILKPLSVSKNGLTCLFEFLGVLVSDMYWY